MAYKLNLNVEIQPVGDQLIVLDLSGNTYYSLNESARFMLENLLLGLSRDDVLNATLNQFDAPKDRIATDLDKLISDLVNNRLIVEIP